MEYTEIMINVFVVKQSMNLCNEICSKFIKCVIYVFKCICNDVQLKQKSYLARYNEQRQVLQVNNTNATQSNMRIYKEEQAQ